MPCSYSNSGAFHEGHGLNTIKIAENKGFGICGLEGQWKVVFDHSFRPCIYVYIRKNRIYTYYTAYIYAG